LDLELVKNAGGIADKVREILKVSEGDSTKVEVLENGGILLVQVPRELTDVFTSYDGATFAAAMAVGHGIIDLLDPPYWKIPDLKAALIGRYCSSVDLMGGKVHHLLKESTVLEGPGHAFRTIMINHFAAITKKNAMNSAALAGTTELLGHYESGDCYGPYEAYTLAAYAFQSLNGNNLVYGLVKENRKGTIGDVAESTIQRAKDDGIIAVKEKLPSGYSVYTMKDPILWNAYACAGTLAAVMVNVGASRAAQMVTATMAYFNDALEIRTSLPSADVNKLHGIGVIWSFYSHSIYGGGGPGIFSGDNPIIKNSFGGFQVPCGAAAVALDAGTQMFSPERTSAIVGKIFGRYDYMREPIKHIAMSVDEIGGGK
jgi:methyl-coenzyme M reductase beta subunit